MLRGLLGFGCRNKAQPKVGANGLANSIEVCTTQGPRVVALQSDVAADPAPRQESARIVDHCPLCLHAADYAAPPVQHAPYRIRGLAADVLHKAYAAASYLTHAYSRSSPRDPPAHS